MDLRNHETHIEHSFDCFCKRVLKGHAIDIQRQAIRRSKREIVFSDMSPQELSGLFVIDDYFANGYIFNVLGENVGVSDCNLAEALNTLPADKREIY